MSTQQGDNVPETQRQKSSSDIQKQPQQQVPANHHEETEQQKLFRQLQSIY